MNYDKKVLARKLMGIIHAPPSPNLSFSFLFLRRHQSESGSDVSTPYNGVKRLNTGSPTTARLSPTPSLQTSPASHSPSSLPRPAAAPPLRLEELVASRNDRFDRIFGQSYYLNFFDVTVDVCFVKYVYDVTGFPRNTHGSQTHLDQAHDEWKHLENVRERFSKDELQL